MATIVALAFHPDGTRLASSSEDETLKLWDVASGAQIDSRRIEGPYAGMNIGGASGITPVQTAALKALGAVGHSLESP
jgi:WD40 repeat protein